MCDCSLHVFASRPAERGETILTADSFFNPIGAASRPLLIRRRQFVFVPARNCLQEKCLCSGCVVPQKHQGSAGSISTDRLKSRCAGMPMARSCW